MDIAEALIELGLQPGCDRAAVRAAYLARVRIHHPDVASRPSPDATRRTARLNVAQELLLAAIDRAGGTVPAPPPPSAPPSPGPRPVPTTHDSTGAEVVDEGTVAIDAPPPEAAAALYEAASEVGNVAYYDRQLGILEMIVRFEGGPSCSVVMTTQGRATHTEVFCTMESIEAEPAPAIRPVLEALVAALRTGPVEG